MRFKAALLAKGLLVSLGLCVFSSSSQGREIKPKVQAVQSVDLSLYAGRWYEIAKNPVVYELRHCSCAQQTFTPGIDRKIDFFISCNRGDVNGQLIKIRGKGVSEDKFYSKFKVNYRYPWKGDYWVIALGEKYQYAVVSDPLLYSLYILSKTPVLDPLLLQEALQRTAAKVTTQYLEFTQQQGCHYPPQ